MTLARRAARVVLWVALVPVLAAFTLLVVALELPVMIPLAGVVLTVVTLAAGDRWLEPREPAKVIIIPIERRRGPRDV